MDTESVHDLTAAYALDALEPGEREAFEEHLAGCESCQAEVAELTLAAVELAHAVEPAEPPPALRERILEAARAERPNVVPLRPRRVSAVWAVASVAACAAIALGLWNVSLHNQLSDSRSSALGKAQVLPVSGVQGSLVVAPSGSAALVALHLPAAPSGKTYEAWIVHGTAPAVPAGLFDGGSGATLARIQGKVTSGSAVAVTVEPAGGSPAPTSKPFALSATV